MRDRHTQRINCLVIIETKQVRACEWDGKSQVGASRPAAGAEIRLAGVFLKARHDLVPCHNSHYELLTTCTLSLRNSEYRRDIEARVTRIGTGMPIHKIKKTKSRTVDKSRFFTRCEVLRAHDAGFRGPAKSQHSASHPARGRAIRSGNHA